MAAGGNQTLSERRLASGTPHRLHRNTSPITQTPQGSSSTSSVLLRMEVCSVLRLGPPVWT